MASWVWAKKNPHKCNQSFAMSGWCSEALKGSFTICKAPSKYIRNYRMPLRQLGCWFWVLTHSQSMQSFFSIFGSLKFRAKASWLQEWKVWWRFFCFIMLKLGLNSLKKRGPQATKSGCSWILNKQKVFFCDVDCVSAKRYLKQIVRNDWKLFWNAV